MANPDPIEVDERDADAINRALLSAWPGGILGDRLDDRRVGSGLMLRSRGVVDRASLRKLSWRVDLCEERTFAIVGEPHFFVSVEVARWAARALLTQTFVLGGACVGSECRCQGLAGAEIHKGRRLLFGKLLDPPVHAGCGCILLAMAGLDPALSGRLTAALKRRPSPILRRCP